MNIPKEISIEKIEIKYFERTKSTIVILDIEFLISFLHINNRLCSSNYI